MGAKKGEERYQKRGQEENRLARPEVRREEQMDKEFKSEHPCTCQGVSKPWFQISNELVQYLTILCFLKTNSGWSV